MTQVIPNSRELNIRGTQLVPAAVRLFGSGLRGLVGPVTFRPAVASSKPGEILKTIEEAGHTPDIGAGDPAGTYDGALIECGNVSERRFCIGDSSKCWLAGMELW